MLVCDISLDGFSGQSELGSLGWDNHGASNGVNPGFEGEGVEMVENDVYTRGNPY